MTSAFSDQKLLSARLKSRLPNSQPIAAMARKIAMGTMPMRAGVILPASFPAHAEATSGMSPTITAGTTNNMSQATTELGEADLAEQTARHRQERVGLGARRIVLDVAVPRINQRLHAPNP